MNIFYVDENPGTAATNLIDKHVVKMVLETAQIMCTALSLHGVQTPYKPTHKNHPAVKWAAQSQPNFLWLFWHGYWLAWEYHLRYDRYHKSGDVIMWAFSQIMSIPSGQFTEPPQCMPEQYRGPNTVEAYRRYYCAEKLQLGPYTGRGEPSWAKERV
jgi:hypothetical protein